MVTCLSVLNVHYYLFLALPHSTWDLSSPTKDSTCASCIRSTESKPLDCQRSPYEVFSTVAANNKPSTIVTFEVVITLSSYLNGLLGRVLRQ